MNQSNILASQKKEKKWKNDQKLKEEKRARK